MGRVSEYESGRALAMLARLGNAASGMQAFAQAAVRALPALVGADISTLSVCTFADGRRRVTTFPDRALSTDDVDCFDRHFFAHPLVHFHREHPDGGVHRISDSWTRTAFHRTSLYADYYRRIDIEYVVAVPLYADSAVLVSMVLNRGGRDFNGSEISLLDALRAPLAAFYGHARAADRAMALEACLRAHIDQGGWHEIEVDGTGHIRRAGRRALSLLGLLDSKVDVQPGKALPIRVVAWLRQQQNGSSIGTVLHLAGPGGGVMLRALPMVAHGAWCVLIADVMPSHEQLPCPDGGRLTTRESEILDWVGRGKSDQQIASILGISMRTVQKHLQHINAKLGVESRLAAVTRTRAMVDAGSLRTR